MDASSQQSTSWMLCGRKFPRSEVVFFSQTIIVYIVIITALINLTRGTDNHTLWVAYLSSCLGYVLPHPRIKKDTTHPE